MFRVLLVISTIFIFLPQAAYSAFEQIWTSTRALAMGGSGVGLADDLFSIYLNPAGLARLDTKGLGATYTTLFGLEELKYSNLAYAQPLGKSNGLGLAYEGFGSVIYEEKTFFLSYGHRILGKTYLGGSLKHMELSIETVGRGSDFGLDLGLLQEFGKVDIGLIFRNVNRPNIGDDLPSRIAAGVSIRPVKSLILALDYSVTQTLIDESLPCLAVGGEFELTEYLLLRAGFQSEPERPGLGFGIRKGWVAFDYAYFNHNLLGPTHQVGLILRFGKR